MIVAPLLQLLRGFAMGAADIVPGVSGGTVALVLGIYRDLIGNIRRGAAALGRGVRGDRGGALRALRELDWGFLLPLLAGIGIAVLALAGIIDNALHDHPEEMAALFFGLVGASIVVAWRLLERPQALHAWIAIAVGIVVAVALGFQAGVAVDPPLWAFFGAGALAICAMILPGISGSFILLMIGMYAPVLAVVNDRDVGTAVVFAVGAVVGLAAFSTVLHRLLDRHHDLVMAVLIGLMVGSLRVLWPWPNGVGIISDEADEAIDGTGLEWPAAGDLVVPLLIAVGAAAIVLVISLAALRRNASPDLGTALPAWDPSDPR